AGADIVETDSFGSMPLVLAEYGLAHRAREISRQAARIAREAADEAATPDRPRFVAGSMGPTTKSISVIGGVTFDEMADTYREQAVGLIEGGVDLLLVETINDPLNAKAALEGIDRALEETGEAVPVAVQASIEAMGTLLAGQEIEAFYTAIAHRDLLWVGLNCATGPEFMTDHLRTLSSLSRFPVACVPNAGLPDETGRYNETPEIVARVLGRFAKAGWVNLLGGCCGTVPEHIRRIADTARDRPPRPGVRPSDTRVSGLETLVVDEDTRPVLVGERTNVLGSRKFRRLISEGSLDEAAEVGRRQVREGAHLLDVCLQDPDRDEVADLTHFLEALTKKVKAPIMLDSTDQRALEEGLKRTPGKSIINSINLEDGERRFQEVVPLAKRFGAALVVGCIDDDKDQAQAITRQRKLEIAQRSCKLLTEKYGVPAEDIIFDPLVFPVGTGDENYIGAGVETIEGVRLIKEALPRCKTVLGISNVSFGLPTAGREVLNSVFLYHCVQAGLDLAIVNSERLVRYPSLSDEERRLAEDLIWWRGDDPIAAFADHFRDRQGVAVRDDRAGLSLDERLARCIVDGTKEGLLADLDEALQAREPMEIINGPLMEGMTEVGRLFNDNRLIVAEVLQSAEAMKAAVAHLEPHMDKAVSAVKGTIILATVKGDVHDIGKNLVDIILSNNGFDVVNLGIKVPPQDLITAYHRHRPAAIGLSGLLVKSAQMMVETVRDFTDAGIVCPILVGGAALSNRFTRLRIAPAYDGPVVYAQDAMSGLSLANRLTDADELERLRGELATETDMLREREEARQAPVPAAPRTQRAPSVRQDVAIPTPPDLKPHVLHDYDLDRV
ncbi:MAG: homocysteine S-methyltransferase family protein, partial [Dehalococcoidia bacterium]